MYRFLRCSEEAQPYPTEYERFSEIDHVARHDGQILDSNGQARDQRRNPLIGTAMAHRGVWETE